MGCLSKLYGSLKGLGMQSKMNKEEKIGIDCIDALEKIKKLKDNSQDIIYADPPYALGSTVLIGKDGKPYYKEARDFMSKWEMPDEKFWEEFFVEANRVLKYGGRVLFFGIDRQLMLFQYYAVASGLEIKQSLYWYFISNFPKATDLSKQIDKRLGVKQQKIGEIRKAGAGLNKVKGFGKSTAKSEEATKEWDITSSNTELGKKYEGYKYSISPLKQVLETVMVFQKATKNKSVLDDVFAYESGDKTISPSIWDIDDGRVPTSDTYSYPNGAGGNSFSVGNEIDGTRNEPTQSDSRGRYPPQMFIDSTCASKIDEQSGELTSGARKSSYTRNATNPNDTYGTFNKNQMDDADKDSGGASRILHHISYLDEELDLVLYSPKVSTFERELGCDGFDKQEKVFNGTCSERSKDIKGVEEKFTTAPTKNSHPTLKPIKLNYQIAKLLKTPNPQNVFFPFSAARSEVIGFEQAGFDPKLFEGSEISEEFNNIGIARQIAWRELDIEDIENQKLYLEKLKSEDDRQGSLF